MGDHRSKQVHLTPRGQVTRATTTKRRYKHVVFFHNVVCLIIIVVDFFHMCECTVGVDVGDGTTTLLKSIVATLVVMGCIVLGRQMNVYFGTKGCTNAMTFVRMDIRFCTMKIHDSMFICRQTMHSIVVHCRIIQSYF
jgi:hypothetical protein